MECFRAYIMGTSSTDECETNLKAILRGCETLGIPLAANKVEGSTTVIIFLSIKLNTTDMIKCLPDVKLQCLQTKIKEWINCKVAKKRDILSILGELAHASPLAGLS